MATLRVTTSILKKRAEDLKELNTKFKSEVSGLNESESRLAGMWEGDAQKEFHTQFQADKTKFDEFYTGIEKYIERLIQAAEAYDKAEADNVSIATTRKAK